MFLRNRMSRHSACIHNLLPGMTLPDSSKERKKNMSSKGGDGMSPETIVDRSVALIALGILDRAKAIERIRKGNKYFYSPAIRAGSELFLGYAFEKGALDIMPHMDERNFIEHFCTVPVAEWLSGFPDDIASRIMEKSFMAEKDALVEKCGNGHEFYPTEDCQNIPKFWMDRSFTPRLSESEAGFLSKYVENIQEKSSYMLLRDLGRLDSEVHFTNRQFGHGISSFYALGREQLSKFPVLNSPDDVDEFKYPFQKHAEAEKIADELISKSYESLSRISGEFYRCPHCGWAISKKSGAHAISRDCGFGEKIRIGELYPKRLLPGVMRFIALPYITLESKIRDAVEKLNLTYEMWPCMDLYDLMIKFNDGGIWVVDAKTSGNPRALRRTLGRETGMADHPDGLRLERCIYVIEDKYGDLRINCANKTNGAITACLNFSAFSGQLGDKARR